MTAAVVDEFGSPLLVEDVVLLRDHRPLERVNEALTEALQGSAATRRLFFAI
jgi:hypothetical protein